MSKYKSGDKFTIEIGEVFNGGDTYRRLYCIKGFNSFTFSESDLNALSKAKLYSEEEVERIKAEVYDKAFKDGFNMREQFEAEKKKPKTIKASEIATDTKVICWTNNESDKHVRHFAGLLNGRLYAYYIGRNSSTGGSDLTSWKHMTLEDGTEVLPE